MHYITYTHIHRYIPTYLPTNLPTYIHPSIQISVPWRYAVPHLAPFGVGPSGAAGVAAVPVSQPGHGRGVARGGSVAQQRLAETFGAKPPDKLR